MTLGTMWLPLLPPAASTFSPWLSCGATQHTGCTAAVPEVVTAETSSSRNPQPWGWIHPGHSIRNASISTNDACYVWICLRTESTATRLAHKKWSTTTNDRGFSSLCVKDLEVTCKLRSGPLVPDATRVHNVHWSVHGANNLMPLLLKFPPPPTPSRWRSSLVHLD